MVLLLWEYVLILAFEKYLNTCTYFSKNTCTYLVKLCQSSLNLLNLVRTISKVCINNKNSIIAIIATIIGLGSVKLWFKIIMKNKPLQLHISVTVRFTCTRSFSTYSNCYCCKITSIPTRDVNNKHRFGSLSCGNMVVFSRAPGRRRLLSADAMHED